MENEDLVAYYKRKLLERYTQLMSQPEREKALELLRGADDETVRRVLEMLEKVREQE